MKNVAKYVVALGVAAGAIGVTPPVSADEALAQESGCLACHAVDKKVIGPSYVDVAAKYKGDAAAVDALTEKVMKGGGGVWGEIPMPPNPSVSPENARALVEWILSL